jgi:hypothetical protein
MAGQGLPAKLVTAAIQVAGPVGAEPRERGDYDTPRGDGYRALPRARLTRHADHVGKGWRERRK